MNAAVTFVTTTPQDGVVYIVGYSGEIGIGSFGALPLGVLPVAEGSGVLDLAILLAQELNEDQLEELRGIVGF